MHPGSTLLIIELLMPDHTDTSPGAQVAVASDVNVLVTLGGRERSETEFKRLLNNVGFERIRVLQTSTLSCIVEAVKA